ncbi:hypothetical protein [Massilia sp. TS11]|uniref:hypothetical protein n=1 Tax=Massilia sp. TS11 TaxID=2908003 RepID=UPI001EDBA3A8|nr:hypothetical protein [Massilia sp. TS11]MCG2583440.1 hypothetical protein [Massilia sp. TS11]
MLLELRAEIAAAAARLIAEDGADYGTAKRKAARLVLGDKPARPEQLPANEQVEEQVRAYLALFQGDVQPARLQRLREVALEVMQMLGGYAVFITGSVLNGTAGAHDDIRLQLFADSAKEVEIFLVNQKLQIELSESPHFRGPRFGEVETVSFMWRQEGVHVELYDLDDLRGARKTRADGTLARADGDQLRALMEAA